LFFALKGDNFNGNLFAAEALSKGAVAAIIDENDGSDQNRILVEDVLVALQQLASDYRDLFDIPVIGITGSNGKTTTKELLHAVLSRQFKTHVTAGNLNNHIGVPLTLLKMPLDAEVAIIEMGANHEHEIEFLCQIAQPTQALITNIGKAHLEGFGSLEGVVRAKGELFDYIRKHGGKVYVNEAIEHVPKLAEGLEKESYSSDFIEIVEKHPQLAVKWAGWEKTCATNLAGMYNISNIAAAVKVGRSFGIEDRMIAQAIEGYMPTNNRSQWQKTAHNDLILDAYNANPSSMALAIENLASMPGSNKFFIIGDMLELGSVSAAEHHAIVEQAKAALLDGILVGAHFKALPKQVYPSFINAQEAADYLRKNPPQNRIILIKGSRGIKLESLVEVL
jgi:UDP-N-acetylmuramoyl-tripeptide--D-alanyl-D-alanine ligase